MFLWPLAQGARWDLEHTGESFMPRVDIHEDKEAIHVDVELAGIPKEKIQVRRFSCGASCRSLLRRLTTRTTC
jgi:HSP20 family molecular chaperone IbpA